MDNSNKKSSSSFTHLVDKATYPCIIFIPSDYVRQIINEDELANLNFMLDRVAIAKKKHEITFLDEDPTIIDLFQKQENLRDNLFDLIDLKEELKESQFDFMLEKYKDHLLVLSFYFNLMVEKINSSDNMQYANYQNLFLVQSDYIKSHIKSLNEALPDYVKKYNRVLDYSQFLFDNFEVDEKPKRKKRKPRKKKVKLITDIESQNFLLRTVFNLDKKILN
ncbi:hypothetical protein [Tenacibaculum sp. 1_MG-2023]|uniref:hypothetical protein n=1 Tax=Tenacibaculum sp. 1_MG-2023 TaxID=3062653 RepID=UPI0026E22C13|nr:hypothetical protein [Tenacibaculum sp. 1_MG-2023]MDO6600653.1 hypothetical protein [Tenacibaculum sp. 1_MG-2023]